MMVFPVYTGMIPEFPNHETNINSIPRVYGDDSDWDLHVY